MSIRVHSVRQFGDGSLEVMIRGGTLEAQYVSDRLNREQGVTISEPKQKESMAGFIYLMVRGSKANPFTRERAIQMFQEDPHVEVVADAGF